MRKVPTFLQIAMHTCPICSAEIAEAMNVQTDRAGVPSSLWWGRKGYRRVVCREGMYCHFITTESDGSEVHKLALLAEVAKQPDQPFVKLPKQARMNLPISNGRKGAIIQYG